MMNDHAIEPALRQEYVRSGLGNLRCFPCCTDGGNHRTNTFCGDSIKVRIAGQHSDSRLLGKFRLMKQPRSFEVGQTLDLESESEFMEAKFVSALQHETRFSFNPPRRWSSTIRENGARVCFTMYLVSTCDQRIVQQIIDSTPFRIVTRTEEEDDSANVAAATTPLPPPQRRNVMPALPPSLPPYITTTTPPPFVPPTLQPVMLLSPPPHQSVMLPPSPPIMAMPPPHYYLLPQTVLPSSAPPLPLPSLNLGFLLPHHLPPPPLMLSQVASPPSYFLNPFQVDVNALRSQFSPRRRSSEYQQQNSYADGANETSRKRSKSDEA